MKVVNFQTNSISLGKYCIPWYYTKNRIIYKHFETIQRNEIFLKEENYSSNIQNLQMNEHV